MKKYFFTGLVTLLPLAVTSWIVHFFVNFLTKPFMGVVTLLIGKLPIASVQVIRTVSQLCILISLFLLTWFIGFVGEKFFFHHMIRFGDHLLTKIPLINKVYKTSKEIVKSLFGSSEKNFQQVVLISFPYTNCYCIGLIAKDAPATCSQSYSHPLVSVFIPTAPNPSTGFLFMSKESDLIYLDMKTEDAIKYVVSCAMIQPGKKL